MTELHSKIDLSVPQGARQVLLHTCCAPCASSIIEALLERGIEPVIFYFNPNIYPIEEYNIRKAEITRYAQKLHLTIVDGDYNHEAWSCAIHGFENEPERGKRCLECFRYRLTESAKYASEHNIGVFTTTLASSRWKLLNQINEAGFAAAAKFPTTTFWDQNWRKGGLTERRAALLKENNFYNQLYCGCEFSKR